METSKVIPVRFIEKFDVEIDLLHEAQYSCPRSKNRCKRAKRWLDRISLPQNYKELYLGLERLPSYTYEVQRCIDQIELDLPRTAPSVDYFASRVGRSTLRRMLVIYAKYNSAVGYIQGLNFIAANLLWHAGEIESFYLLLALMDDFSLWENYVPGMPGVHKRVHIIEFLLIDSHSTFYRELYHAGISVNILCSDWVITLFANLAPLEQMHAVFTLIFEEGWKGFYKLCITILERLYNNFQSRHLWDAFMCIKGIQITSSSWEAFLKLLKKGRREKLNWVSLCKEAKARKINSRAVDWLNQNWRNDLHM